MAGEIGLPAASGPAEMQSSWTSHRVLCLSVRAWRVFLRGLVDLETGVNITSQEA